MAWLLFGLLLMLFLINVPVAVALGLASMIVLIVQDNVPLMVIVQKMFTSTDSFTLMAVPFFILAGKLMESGGISKRLITFSSTLVGSLHGGLAMVSIVTCMFFAAISGSAAATTAAVGSILIPAMVKRGYDKSFSTAIQAAGGTIGVMIPPSVPLILFGVIAGASIGDLFIAGIIPGVFVGMSLILVAYFISRKRGYGKEERSSIKEVASAFKSAILAILMPVIILGGIYGGIFTPTEGSVVAVVYGLIVGLLIYKEIKWKDLPEIFISSAITSSVILFIISCASIFGFLLTREQIPAQISEGMLGITSNAIMILIIINVILLIVGTFLETSAAIVIMAPILVPIASAAGMDLVHFGVIMVVNLAIGMITPPVGINLFVASNIANIRLEHIVRAIMPFIIVLIIDVLILSFMPSISLFLLDK
ncbi:TRAP transporter large permease subunit [Bacillus sp. ISL-47]|uniref:TRAP transporter large permease n=1 Tax=Bacillus sp. ISL-47 TaxID=2819130 RepID=UPI001BE57D08|nr:TRAP transporter large permease subunit [Bacillus sp. ISL-47]MBT2687198.1 TRAP transporter large permease subunit [Bacillus sp. ISL-47]MBT2709798.1 TRAP transporter large permease subunit [Pseudomonas sp. ISL-84]